MKKPLKPICQSCYDKGFYTVMEGERGNRYFKAPYIQERKCTICNGRPKEYARKQLKQMLLAVRNGGFITPVLEKIMTWL